MPKVQPDREGTDERKMAVEVEGVQGVHEPSILECRLLKVGFPEDAEALFQGHDVCPASDGLRSTLLSLASNEVVQGKRESEEQYLGAVLKSRPPSQGSAQGAR